MVKQRALVRRSGRLRTRPATFAKPANRDEGVAASIQRQIKTQCALRVLLSTLHHTVNMLQRGS